ncbi:hypothetical protein GQF56_16055 [Rhodobacter sphaeroides]|jgi:hypothetical protein|uniref:hypothetical protein n=1 Tax=Cereibacter sphaeroides TaxID=1063 RepID=UPI000A6F7FED|nr:hypothetical protein [Cereibacter sphaeroides]MVX49366.1 hypothetical protein [Cereibacter sphaeroides]QHA15124.1 hypothetical protein GQY06_19355 [Cereibacter sphaeroides]QJC85840.1 hypothetical protein HGN32_16645 [Cereibacter sphaeroides]GEM95301.1 hypothetical protein RSP03_43680 [Cereibacter sphaeroides]
MAYQAIVEAREAAEARQESLREAVRLGLQMKREQEERKAALQQERALNSSARA